MKIFNKISIVTVLVVAMALFVPGLTGPVTILAATAPNLGVAVGYSVFGNAGVTNNVPVSTTHVWGNVGGNGVPSGTGVTNLDDATQVDGTIDAGPNGPVVGAISFAYGDLADEALTQIPILDLDILNTVGPGVYDIGVGATFTNTLTLNGAGVYIFRSAGGTVARTAGGTMSLTNGATACNVFWQIADSMTFATGVGSIYGTIITNTAAITFADNGVTLQGRAWAATQVTMINTVITEPTCAAPPASGNNTITVVKQVINDNGGTATFSDFPLFVNGNPVTSGQSIAYAPGLYTVTETNRAGYTTSFTGNCNASGQVNHGGINTQNDICTVVNNDVGAPVVPPVPPLIDVVKVPSPLSLPAGPGLVTYTYTLDNIGTVPVTNVTMIGDTCSPIILISGDTNSDARLDVNETWVHRCSTTLSATHTNTVVATGWANGLNAIDVASSTVVVGSPIVPPLIHVTKVPNPLTLPAGAGAVTYMYTVTNPGTAALSDVSIADDKCTGLPGRVVGHPGDLNQNNLLESNEAWSFTCQTNLTQTTTNTAIATGFANGLVATDFALATVVVAVPGLPNTGLPLSTAWSVAVLAGLLIVILGSFVVYRKRVA